MSYHDRMGEPTDSPDAIGDEDVPALEEKPLQQPPDSQITVEHFPDGLTINVPPAGLWRGTQGLFPFAILWNGFMSVFTPVLLVGIFGNKAQEQSAYLIVPALLSLFWLVGIGLLLGSLNMGRRRAAIAVTGGTLMVLQTGLFGSKQRDWGQADVENIRAAPSGMEVNNKPILELQIYGLRSGKFALLAGRRDDELFWIASELRAALGLSESAS
jgi:hypothetical protein